MLDAIADNPLGAGFLAVVVIVWARFGVYPLVSERVGVAREQRDPTWTSLTQGELNEFRKGETWAFWGSGSTGREGEHSVKLTNRVVIDEVALAFIMLQGRRRSTRRAWLRRDDVPVLVLRPVFHGTLIIDPVSRLRIRVRVLKADEVARRLEALGWRVRIADGSTTGP